MAASLNLPFLEPLTASVTRCLREDQHTVKVKELLKISLHENTSVLPAKAQENHHSSSPLTLNFEASEETYEFGLTYL